LNRIVTTLPGLALMAIALSACALATDKPDKQAERVYGYTWIAEEVGGWPIAGDVAPKLVVNPDGKVSGHAGCNGFFGSVIIDGEAMSFGNLGATRMACPEPAMSQEDKLLRALDSTRGYRLLGSSLVLLDGEGDALVRFRNDSGA
jgi:heat shock protein HslJ